MIDFPFGPDFAAVAVHDALDRRQPNPRAVEFGHGVQALKGAEQFAGIGHVEPSAVIAHEVDRLAVVLADAEFNRGIVLGAPLQASQLPERGRPHALQAAGAIVHGYTGTHTFNTADGATEPSDAPVCDVIGGASYWVSFVPEQDGVLYLNTDGSDYNTVLAVFVRRANGNLRLMVCDNNGGSDPGTSALSVPVEAGRTNFVMIDGVKGETGNLHLNYSLVVPSSLTFLGMTAESYARLRVTGRPELNLVLQVSDDMTNWTPLATNSSLTGTLDYTDTTTPPRSQRLYRALMLP